MRVVVFGSGGLAKELIGYIKSEPDEYYEIVGVVSTEKFNNSAYKYRVYEKPPAMDDEVRFLMAVSDPDLKRKFVSDNLRDEHRWINYVHPTAHISPYAHLGKGCFFGPNAIVAGDPKINDFVTINNNATVGHDSVIGSYTTLHANSEVCGNCWVGDGCLFGIGSYVLPRVRLPGGTRASAGAVIRRSIDEPSTLYGDPGKPREVL